MSPYSLSHLSDSVLLQNLSDLVVRERTSTAQVVAHIGEVEARNLHVPAGHSSIFSYCMNQLRMSGDAAYKRIAAARTARKYPRLFTDLAEGRLHLTAICLIGPHLTPTNSDELIAAATHQGKRQIQRLLAHRFGELQEAPKVPIIRAMPIKPVRKLVPEPVDAPVPTSSEAKAAWQNSGSSALSLLQENFLGDQVATPSTASAPRDREWYLLSVALPRATQEKLRRAQELLGHSVPSGDLAQVLDRALDLALVELQKRKFAATKRARAARASRRPRHIPAHVKRAVWKRDQGRCTYVAPSGRRCEARTRIEFDHVDPVAWGGRASTERMRLRCRAHNQYEAERTFGAAYMKAKREGGHARPTTSRHRQEFSGAPPRMARPRSAFYNPPKLPSPRAPRS